MFTDKQFCCFLHALLIQWPLDPPGAMSMQRRALFTIQYPITIAATGRRKTRMKFVIDPLGPGHVDVIREMTVRTELPAALATRIFGVKMDNLARRMNTRVRTAGASHSHGGISDRCQGFFDELLYAQAGFLALPAVIRRAVVLNAERDANYY